MSSPAARLSWLFTLQCSIGVLGCAGGGDQVCTVDSECSSHFCRADGTCGPSATDPDAGTTPDGAGSGSSMGLCTPNHDGTITADEVPLAAGKMARYRIATSATWATAGTAAANNTRTWDLTGTLANDADSPITLTPPTGAWWAAEFPTATYYTQLAQSSPDLLGVFHVDGNGVTLLGVVSPTKPQLYTELTYDPPATILKVPFKAGDTWTSTSTVSGRLAATGVANYTEVYTSNVDQAGTMTTPYGAFPVLRVATQLSQKVAVTGVEYNSVKSFAWVAECFGSVANATSQNNESNAEFSDDAEVRRIIP